MTVRKRILAYLEQWFAEHDDAPTNQQIAEAVGIRNCTVGRELTFLACRGYVHYTPGRVHDLRWRGEPIGKAG